MRLLYPLPPLLSSPELTPSHLQISIIPPWPRVSGSASNSPYGDCSCSSLLSCLPLPATAPCLWVYQETCPDHDTSVPVYPHHLFHPADQLQPWLAWQLFSHYIFLPLFLNKTTPSTQLFPWVTPDLHSTWNTAEHSSLLLFNPNWRVWKIKYFFWMQVLICFRRKCNTREHYNPSLKNPAKQKHNVCTHAEQKANKL